MVLDSIDCLGLSNDYYIACMVLLLEKQKSKESLRFILWWKWDRDQNSNEKWKFDISLMYY